MKFLDWTVVIAYLAYVIWDGIRMTKHSRSVDGYFLAGRSLPWWAVGLSVMATQLSAITLVGTTGQAYADGMRFLQFYYGLPFAMVILCVTAVPFFYRAKVFTAYEYLEKRFDAKTRTLASLCFLVSRCLGVGVIIAAPSIILSIVLGWNEAATIFTIGISTTIYTMIGGVQAVTWTDVKQMVVIFIGLTICLIVIFSKFPAEVSVIGALDLAGAAGRLTTVETRFNFKETYTIWSGLLGGLFLFLAYFGCDQSQVQRFLTAKSVNEGRTSLLMSAFIKIPMQFFILLIGVMVFVFYQFEAPPMVFDASKEKATKAVAGAEFAEAEKQYQAAHAERRAAALALVRAEQAGDAGATAAAKTHFREAEAAFLASRKAGVEVVRQATKTDKYNDVNYVFPTFVVKYMPAGVVGLIIAAIFAAAMSSVSAELNALATATVIDFYRRHFKPADEDAHYVFVGRLATAFWGVFACIVALYSTSLGSLIEVVNKFGSFFYGSLLGVFVLAVAVPRATGRGAFWGLLFGVASVWITSLYTDIAFLWFNAIGCVVVVVTGYLVSLTDTPASPTLSREKQAS